MWKQSSAKQAMHGYGPEPVSVSPPGPDGLEDAVEPAETLNQSSQALQDHVALQGGDVIRPLHFFSPPPNNEKPSFTVTEPNGVGFKNYPCSSHPVLIRDVRGHPRHEPFSLGVESFALLHSQPCPPGVDISNDDQVRDAYTDEAKALAMAHVEGVESVHIFDSTIRRASAAAKMNRPVKKVHVDQSARAAILRAQQFLPAEQVEAIEQGKLRLRIVNVWRPLRGPITDHPLCLAESPSVPEDDLVSVDHIYPQGDGETYHCKYRGMTDHHFWYLSAMEVTDVWLIQCFDSVRDSHGRQRRCAHASFEMIETDPGGEGEGAVAQILEGRLRESIEVRCLVLGGDLQEEHAS
ncbi:hypothetical protein B0J13DRAFT_54774 [Dactylonectria estremocensis]|uniref:Uncharacterized protein n=1 Tax=Dactylonectria estremocensis TaxID=1079267 RepID=A0A9P9ENW3_9HYPO|nr:hypothetical protein B0J13DRAFT_54774 [Dactylonectria estremocensis]